MVEELGLDMSVLAWSSCYGGSGGQSICLWQTSDSLQWETCTAVAATTRHLGVTHDQSAALSIGGSCDGLGTAFHGLARTEGEG